MLIPVTTCCILNLAPNYNAAIYKLLDQRINCDFFIGNRIETPIQLMNYSELTGFKRILRFFPLTGNFYWQGGAVRIAFKSYKNFIITGEPYCISTWFILIINRLLKKNTFLWTHGWYGNETVIKKAIKKLFFRLSDKVLLYGDLARNLMIKDGFHAQKLICVFNSLDFDTQCEIRKKLKPTDIYADHFHNEFPVLIYIGRIQKSKKLGLLVDALHILKKNGVNCNLVIVGKDIDETNLQELVSSYKLTNFVWFFGPSYDESELGQLIYNADICVSPGNVGLTAMHSLVYGTPVITHNNIFNQGPEFEAIEKGKTGDFFEEDSVSDLCDKITSWISLPIIEREFVRQNCFSVISRKYNPHVQIEIFEKLLL